VSVDASNLRDDLTRRIVERWGYTADAGGIGLVPIASRTVLLVDTVMGIVKNGGFSYLLEDILPGDKNLVHAIAAFRRIGSDRSAEIIDDVLAGMGASVVPRSPQGRYKKYLGMPEEWRDSLDFRFWDTDAEVEVNLTRYISEHQSLINEELVLPRHVQPLDPECY
jgi:hypothetical protein